MASTSPREHSRAQRAGPALAEDATSQAAIEEAVQRLRIARPPLRGPALGAASDALLDLTKGRETAWACAVQAGAYEQLARCMDAYPDDADVQVLCCRTLVEMALETRREDDVLECWEGHAEAAVRAGVVRAVVAALHEHAGRAETLLFVVVALNSTLATRDSSVLAVARSGRAAEPLAAAISVALNASTAVNAASQGPQHFKAKRPGFRTGRD